MLDTVTFVGVLGCGLAAGVFFAFSTFVMQGLRRVPAETGMVSMQAINVAAPTPWFMTALMGTAAVCVVLAVWSLLDWGAGAGYRLAGAVLYLVGTIGLTIVYHVPRNDALARVLADDPAAPDMWEHYASRWTAWNHVRTVAALGAAALLTLALLAS
jgi:uncharacterized membrane protein